MSEGTVKSGVLLAILGFSILSVGDAVLKTMAPDWPVTAVAALRFVIGAVALTTLLMVKEGRKSLFPNKPWLQVARGFCLAGASLTFFSAIFLMPLAEAMAITFLSPLLTALFSGPLLGEKVKRVVWLGCAVGLFGVLLILRPNLALLGWPALLPLVSAIFFALIIITNKASMGSGSALAMQTYMAVIASCILVFAAFLAHFSGIETFQVTWPNYDVALRCAFVAFTASTAHWLIYLGTARSGASQVAPAAYIQMLVAIILGWWMFSDIPDTVTVVGATIIIGAGIYLWRDDVRKS